MTGLKRVAEYPFEVRVTAAVLSLALIASLAALVVCGHLHDNYDRKSLAGLERQAELVKSSFTDILGGFRPGRSEFRPVRPSEDVKRLFAAFRDDIGDPEHEGLALYSPSGALVVWFGRVLSLQASLAPGKIESLTASDQPFLVKDKASVFLASVIAAEKRIGFIVRFKLLAFIPQVESLYLREYHALSNAFRTDFKADYWDFRDDVTGFESFFADRHDVYSSGVRQENGVMSLFFPLRARSGRIMATVTVYSPPLSSRLTAIKEKLALFLIGLGFLAAVAVILRLGLSPREADRTSSSRAMTVMLLAAAARFVVLPLPRLEMMKKLAVFSPAAAGFPSPAGLTASPFDILMTSLFLLTVAICLSVMASGLRRDKVRAGGLTLGRGAVAAGLGLAAAGAIMVFQTLVREAVMDSSLSPEHWPLGTVTLILHIGMAAGLAALLVILHADLGAAVAFSGRTPPAAACVLVPAVLLLVLTGAPVGPAVVIGRILILLVPFAAAFRPVAINRALAAVVFAAAAAFWMASLFEHFAYVQTRRLMTTTIKHSAVSQETWGKFLLDQTFSDLERNQRSIMAFFRDPSSGVDFARSLWSRSSVAAANWYSCLELRNPSGMILSRFALNVPKFYGGQPQLEPSDDWNTVHATMEFLGQKKEFLVGYKDFAEDNHFIGRLIIYMSLDPEMLPFTYSANPYFEALRSNPMPSLNQFDIGYAVFDHTGNAVFNPRKISWRPSAVDMARLAGPGSSAWLRFTERGTVREAYLFPSGDGIHALFLSHKKLRTEIVAFLRLFFFYLALAAAVLLARTLRAGRLRLQAPLRSFSVRVYAAFLAVALVPMLLYSFFTTDLFNRVFNQRFISDSTDRAEYARNLMEAFLIVQGREGYSYLAPSEDLALWMSSTLSNDINIFSNGVLLASSRAEIFSNGLVPDVLDGEAYAALVLDHKPFFAKNMRLGRYSYQTLIVPYTSGDRTLFLSLPFPFEKQELLQAASEIVEFLVLLSSLFIILVMILSRSIRSLIIVPVGKLVEATKAVGLGSLDVHIEHRSNDEMMTLIDGFNAMVKNLRAREQELAEMTKKVAWTAMAQKVAHEIKNPLTPIQLSAEHVLKVYEDKRGDFDKTLRESIFYIIKEVESLRRISQEFMELARDTALEREPVDLKELVEETMETYAAVLKDRIGFEVEVRGNLCTVSGDRAKLITAFRNIVANATEAIGRKGTVRAEITGRDATVSVAVTDTGSGMDKETLERIFDPYFSTKESGTGLGLPIARKIIEEHGGTIRAESRPGLGTSIEIELPVEAGPPIES